MGDGFLVVYSIIQRRSFELLEDFRVSILRVKETDSFPMVLVGNKCDMESLREVSFFEAQVTRTLSFCNRYLTQILSRNWRRNSVVRS
jgi:GTPase SAR1 family protein